MNRLAVFSLVLFAPISTGCVSILFNSVAGSGISKSETRQLEVFSRISLAGSGTVVVTCGESEHFLEVTTDDNILELMETVVVGDTLALEFQRRLIAIVDACFRPRFANDQRALGAHQM